MGAIVALVLPATAVAAGPQLLPTALRLGPDFELIGRGSFAHAHWSREAALDGRFSVRAEVSEIGSEASVAGAQVRGVEGVTVGSLGNLGVAVLGPCTERSPRFAVLFDSNADGVADGSGLYGCSGHPGVPPAPGWTSIRADATAPDTVVILQAGARFSAGATVIEVFVLTDAAGITYFDRVEIAGVTLGEPGGR